MPKKELFRRLRDTRRTQCMDLLVWKNSAYNIISFEEATSNYIGFNYQEFIFIRLILTQSFQKHRINISAIRISLPAQPILHSIIFMYEKGTVFGQGY